MRTIPKVDEMRPLHIVVIYSLNMLIRSILHIKKKRSLRKKNYEIEEIEEMKGTTLILLDLYILLLLKDMHNLDRTFIGNFSNTQIKLKKTLINNKLQRIIQNIRV